MITPDQFKTTVHATLDRLNASGVVIASLSDIMLGLARQREAKVQEACKSIFSSFTLEELAVASRVLDEMFPRVMKLESPTTFSFAPTPTATPTSPPATLTTVKLKRKRK